MWERLATLLQDLDQTLLKPGGCLQIIPCQRPWQEPGVWQRQAEWRAMHLSLGSIILQQVLQTEPEDCGTQTSALPIPSHRVTHMLITWVLFTWRQLEVLFTWRQRLWTCISILDKGRRLTELSVILERGSFYFPCLAKSSLHLGSLLLYPFHQDLQIQ